MHWYQILSPLQLVLISVDIFCPNEHIYWVAMVAAPLILVGGRGPEKKIKFGVEINFRGDLKF